LSSNMIKAYSIAYDTKKVRNLNMEERENELLERAKKLLALQEFSVEPKAEGEFVQGLFAENLGDIEPLEEAVPQEEAVPVLSEQDIEEMKASLREEIMAEMMPIINRKEEEIINKARTQADGLIEAAKNDAEIAKESIFKLASAQGYEEGTKRAEAEENRMLEELEARRQQLEAQYEAKIAELEPAFATVLVELVKKVTNIAYDNHKEVLMYLIETGLGFAQKDAYFDVHLNEEDYKKYEPLFPKIKERYKDKYALDFKKDEELPEGSCKLENENRVIDCGLGVRLNGLLEELSRCDVAAAEPEVIIQEVEVEVLPTGDYCNIPMHRTWPVLFVISAVVNVGLVVALIYVIIKKRNTVDNTPLVSYDIDDDMDF